MLTSINLRITVEHASGLDDEAVQQRVLAEFQEMARQGTVLSIADGHELYTHSVEPTFTDAQRAALLEALDTEVSGFRDCLRRGDLPADEVAGLQEEVMLLQDVRDRVEE